LRSKKLRWEKEPQRLFEANLEELLDIFLASEFCTSFGARIDTLGREKMARRCSWETYHCFKRILHFLQNPEPRELAKSTLRDVAVWYSCGMLHVWWQDDLPQREGSLVRRILSLAAGGEIISFAGGLPNAKHFPVQEVGEVLAAISQEPPLMRLALQYGETDGYYPLREIIAESYARKDNLPIKPEQVGITTGSQQAIDLLSRVLPRGSVVAVERPTYLAALSALRLGEHDFVEVVLEEEGPEVGSLPERAAAFYAVPNFQNPSGITWSNARREAIARWAHERGALLVEDDPYGEIRFRGDRQRPLAAFAPKHTLLLGSFSKILAPGMRVGWFVAPEGGGRLFEEMRFVKESADLHTSTFAQVVIAEYYRRGFAQAHIEAVARAYGKRAALMRELFHELLPEVRTTDPEGGMFLWAVLPEGMDARELFTIALEEGVAFVPGDVFYASAPERRTLRINFTAEDEGGIEEGVRRLARAYARCLRR